MSAVPHPLADDPLALAVFEKIRRIGANRADGQTIPHGGHHYKLTSHTISVFSTVHVVLEKLDGLGKGYQRAMAIVEATDNGYRGCFDGASLLIPALCRGVHIPDRTKQTRFYRVLPMLDVPALFNFDKANEAYDAYEDASLSLADFVLNDKSLSPIEAKNLFAKFEAYEVKRDASL